MASVSFTATGSANIELPLRQFDGDEYVAMAEAGVFENQRKVELIGGYVVDMSPSGSDHNSVIIQLAEVFAPLVDRFKISVQGTLRLDHRNVFDPDFMLLKRRSEGYRKALPTPADVALLIEVSGTSLRSDVGVKLPIYSAHNIADYWVVDLEREVVLVHRCPASATYSEIREFRGDAMITPWAAPEFGVTTRELFA